MRASRLLALLVRLQLRGDTSASVLADELDVSVRTIYRDVAALRAAGIPIDTEVGRHGGVRLDPTYRVGGLPRLERAEARGVLFAAVPAIAAQLGLDAGVADRTLLPSMEATAETAARIVRERLVVEPTHWFEEPEATPALVEMARAVWESREVRLDYRDRDLLVHPLGLVLKRDVWYALGRTRGEERLFRLSRVERPRVLTSRFDRPPGFDLVAAWERRRSAFLAAMTPRHEVEVRLDPARAWALRHLAEARPASPLDEGLPRDEDGRLHLTLWFENEDRAVRLLLQLGAGVEVLRPRGLRDRLRSEVSALAELYAGER